MSQPISRTFGEQPPSTNEYVVLLPVIEFEEARRLLPLAVAVARSQGGRVVALKVVIVPADQPLSEGVLETRRYRAELDAIAEFNQTEAVVVRPAVNVAHSLAAGIRTAAEEQRANLLMLGWRADQS